VSQNGHVASKKILLDTTDIELVSLERRVSKA
jgi:hypothetical protein